MSGTVFIAVITAALLHASWNALVKGGADKRLNMAGVVIGHVPAALLVLCFVPAPDPASYPYLVAGMVLHFGYQWFLLASYKIGDLTQVYPIARGSAPLLVALVSVAFLIRWLTGWVPDRRARRWAFMRGWVSPIRLSSRPILASPPPKRCAICPARGAWSSLWAAPRPLRPMRW